MEDDTVYLEEIVLLLSEPDWAPGEKSEWREFLEKVPKHVFAIALATIRNAQGNPTHADQIIETLPVELWEKASAFVAAHANALSAAQQPVRRRAATRPTQTGWGNYKTD